MVDADNGGMKSAEDMASQQKTVSISEFFEKNRHLLGYDNRIKALMIIVKEAVDNSVTYDTPIVLLENGETKIRKIGEFIDEKMGPANSAGAPEDLRGGKLQKCRVEGIKALCFGRGDLKLKFRDISTVFRHRVNSRVFRITLEGGRHVDLTDYHAVFAYEGGDIRSVKTSDLEVGDRVAVPNSAWEAEPTTEIDLLGELLRLPEEETKNIGLYGIRELLPKVRGRLLEVLPRGERYRIGDFRKCDRIPLNVFRKLGAAAPEGAKLDFMFGRSRVPAKLPVTQDLAEFLGLYAAEGSISGGHKVNLSFGAHEMDLIRYAGMLFRDAWGARVSEIAAHRTAINITANSTMVAFLLKKVFRVGDSARTKRVPRFVFNFPLEKRKRFLMAYCAGDGYPSSEIFSCFGNGGEIPNVQAERVVVATASRELANGLLYLVSSLGLDCTIEKKSAEQRQVGGIKASFGESYVLYLYTSQERSQINRLPFEGVVGMSSDPKLNYNISQKGQVQVVVSNALRLEQAGQLQFTEAGSRLAHGGLGLLRIKSIEELDYDREWVYDVSVPGEENFAGGFGPIMCHNSLDACEESRILPDINVKIEEVEKEKYRVLVRDNGPGIVKKQIPKIFGTLLYGSKFHRLRQSRGQQGLGISVAVLYSQLTTGQATEILSSTGDGVTHKYALKIDVKKNEPVIISEETINGEKWHGVQVAVVCEGTYREHKQGTLEYIKQTAICNPYLNITFDSPTGRHEFKRSVEKLPKEPKEIKPHLHGIEVGILSRMFKETKARSLAGFFVTEFSRVGSLTAKQICEKAGVDPKISPRKVTDEHIVALGKAVREVKLTRPPTDCLSPLGNNLIKEGLIKELNPEFVSTISRSPTAYRGWPFLVEAGIAYGGSIEVPNIMRFANRVPLIYQQGDCAITKAAQGVDWKRYKIEADKLPLGPLVLFVHMASVWVPFTSESKEAVASYPIIMKETKLAIQEVARKLSIYLSGMRRAQWQAERKSIFERYADETAGAISELTGENKDKIKGSLKKVVEARIGEALTEEEENGKNAAAESGESDPEPEGSGE